MSQYNGISKIGKTDAVDWEPNESIAGMSEENIYLYWMLSIVY